MKRKEMVKILALELEDIRKENYFDEKGSEWCGNLILMKLEEAGMLPPETKGRFTAEDMKTFSDNCEFDIGDEWMGYEWESESE